MLQHLAQYDLTGTVDLGHASSVADAVCGLLGQLPGGVDADLVRQGFVDLAQAFWGRYPGLLPCDTPYHDLRHSLGTALVTARLVDGHEKAAIAEGKAPLGRDARALAVLLGLFHDVGFLRTPAEAELNGASLVREHEQRSVDFTRAYLAAGPLAALADEATLIHTTNFARPVADTLAGRPPAMRMVGMIVGSADLISQMAGRYYLERCRDYLYREFVIAGADRAAQADGSIKMLYTSGEDLLSKTPGFYEFLVKPRLENDFAACYRYLAAHFGGEDLYATAIGRNLDYLRQAIASGDFSRLRRTPPTLIPQPD